MRDVSPDALGRRQYDWPQSASFQFVSSFAISPEWRIHFATGLDGLSLMLILLAAIVTLAASGSRAKIEKYETRVLCLSAFHLRRRARCVCFARPVFLLCLSRARADSDFSPHRNLGDRQSRRCGMENHDLSRAGQFHSPDRTDLALRKCAGRARAVSTFALCRPRARLIRFAAKAQHNIYLLLLVGFGILVSLFPFHTWAPEAYASAPAPAAMLHAGVLKKFGLYGFPPGHSVVSGRRAALDGLLLVLLLCNIIYIGLGYDRAEAARLDAWLFERDAHGLHFPRDRQRQHSRHDRRCRPDVCPWTFHCAAFCGGGRNSQTHQHARSSKSWAASPRPCRLLDWRSGSPHSPPSAFPVSPISPRKS